MINKLRELLDAATPGPWGYNNGGSSLLDNQYREIGHIYSEDVHLIVAMRNCLPELIAVAAASARYWEGYTSNCVVFDGSYDDQLEEALAALNKRLETL